MCVNCSKHKVEPDSCRPIIPTVSCVPCRTRKIACDYRASYLSAYLKLEFSLDDSTFEEALKLLRPVRRKRNAVTLNGLKLDTEDTVPQMATSASVLGPSAPFGTCFSALPRLNLVFSVDNFLLGSEPVHRAELNSGQYCTFVAGTPYLSCSSSFLVVLEYKGST